MSWGFVLYKGSAKGSQWRLRARDLRVTSHEIELFAFPILELQCQGPVPSGSSGLSPSMTVTPILAIASTT
jgi:hypothetical protein